MKIQVDVLLFTRGELGSEVHTYYLIHNTHVYSHIDTSTHIDTHEYIHMKHTHTHTLKKYKLMYYCSQGENSVLRYTHITLYTTHTCTVT